MVDTGPDQAKPDDMSILAGIIDLRGVVFKALSELEIKESDKGVAALILSYAVEIDKDRKNNLRTLGPLLLQGMEALQMSPRARTTALKGGVQNDSKPASKLDELRKRREARKSGTKDIHTTTA